MQRWRRKPPSGRSREARMPDVFYANYPIPWGILETSTGKYLVTQNRRVRRQGGMNAPQRVIL